MRTITSELPTSMNNACLKNLRVFLIDDHPAVRQGLSLLLEHNGMQVCAQADSVAGALQQLPGLEPDLALVDLSFEHEEGFDLIGSLSDQSVQVIVYSMHEGFSQVERSLACGAAGYVSKREDSAILLHAIEEVRQHRAYISPRATQALEQRPVEVEDSLPRCSNREIQILQLLGQGLGNSEIAESLSLSVRTVETYCARINEKLELSGMKELRQFAIRHYYRP